MPDFAKLIDGLKTAIATAGIYKFAIALACGAYWYCAVKGILPGAEQWEIRAAGFGVMLFGFLWFASAISALLDFIPPRKWILHWLGERHERARVKDYIPHMTDIERQIIGYLLTKNQKMFVATLDGGHAMPLISQQIIVRALGPNQVFDHYNVPWVIPDNIWRVLIENKENFPYEQPCYGDGIEPWHKRNF
jgi:hypothetical protein